MDIKQKIKKQLPNKYFLGKALDKNSVWLHSKNGYVSTDGQEIMENNGYEYVLFDRKFGMLFKKIIK
jgi:hypothetical protein